MTPKELIDLITAGEIDKAREAFKTRATDVVANLKEFQIKEHAVITDPMRRDKVIPGKEGKVRMWKIPIPYQKKIVNTSVAFLFGKPVKLIQKSTGTDAAFLKLKEVWEDMRMHSLNRETARILFSETEVARLYIPYTNSEGQGRVKCMLLAQSLGDTLYTFFDIFGSMQAFGRKYLIKEKETETEHFDIYTSETIYRCIQTGKSWQVDGEENKLKKIPVAYYHQPQTEWADVQPMIERLEWLMSTRADVNDYSANPILVIEGEIVSLPDKHEVAKVVQVTEHGKVSYLTPQMAIEMVRDERQTLEQAIHYCTDTPDLSEDKARSLGQDSGKALEMRFFPALLKAMDKQEQWGEMLDREINIIKAFLGQVNPKGATNESKATSAQIEALKVGVEFGNPLPDNVGEYIEMLNLASGGATMSQKTALSLNPLVTDSEKEFLQLETERKAKSEGLLGGLE